jgi:exonuclease III
MVTKQLQDHEGRIIAASVQVDNTELNIMNIYAPNKASDRKSFMEQLWRYKPGEENVMLAGDFNCIENLELDKEVTPSAAI